MVLLEGFQFMALAASEVSLKQVILYTDAAAVVAFPHGCDLQGSQFLLLLRTGETGV